MARCPKCGYESDLDIFVCDNCMYQLKVENIESIPLFTRPPPKITTPDKTLKRIIKIINPLTTPLAFRDINRKKNKKGRRMIISVNAFILGLLAVIVQLKTKIQIYASIDVAPITNWWMLALYDFVIFLVFYLFGIFYYFLLFKIYDFAYSISANFAVQLDGLLAIRYNIRVKSTRFADMLSGKSRLRKQQGVETQFSYDKAAKKQLTKIKQSGKYRIMGYAYAPLIVFNLLCLLVLLIALPPVNLGTTTNFNSTIMEPLWSSWGWGVCDVIQMLGIIYIAATMSVAQREIGNTSTTKLLVGNAIMSLVIIFFLMLLRPTLGLNIPFLT
ncbi:MAG: hypothetical protein ACTSVU_00700 [Promethearchaeota archaeon]